MKNPFEEIQKLRLRAEPSKNKTAQLQQAIAQIEAAISRKENQKVLEKSQIYRFAWVKKFQTFNFYLRILKTTYK